MDTARAQRTESERGQASVELLGALPAVLLIALVAWQLALAGHAAWLAGNAARVAARADAVGADPARAARGALPARLRRGLTVAERGGGRVDVAVRIPVVLEGAGSRLRAGASAALPQQ
jgi:pilus assembly protein CpaE